MWVTPYIPIIGLKNHSKWSGNCPVRKIAILDQVTTMAAYSF
jgi:hypothetical protein